MLTFIKKIFVWWNQETLGTKLYTFFFGKFVGKDDFGNKYYENKKKTKRWIIYKDEIDASKIPNDWFSWIHFMKNKVEYKHDTKKYKWTNRFSKRRLKCKGTENKKELKVYDICNNAASGNVCTYNNNKDYNGTGIYDQLVIGRMEVNVSTGRIDNSGNKKPKKGILYFQIR